MSTNISKEKMLVDQVERLSLINNVTYRAVDLPLIHEYNKLHNMFFNTLVSNDSCIYDLPEVSMNALCKYKCLCELEKCHPHSTFVEYLEQLEVCKEREMKRKECEEHVASLAQRYELHKSKYNVENEANVAVVDKTNCLANSDAELKIHQIDIDRQISALKERQEKQRQETLLPMSELEQDPLDAGTSADMLNFDRTYIGEKALLPILMTLSLCTFLRRLSLCQQRMNSFHVEMMCGALKPLPYISSIDVSRNPCGTDGVTALLQLVVSKNSIVECKIKGIHAVAGLVRRLEAALIRNRVQKQNKLLLSNQDYNKIKVM